MSRLIIAVATWLLISPPTLAQPGPDEAGQHVVGFRSGWELDWSRAYATVFDEGETYGRSKSPRPILVNVWYPADPETTAPPMPHGDYLRLETEDPALAPLARALSDHAREILVEQVLDKREDALDETERGHLDSLLAKPTRCRRDAKPAQGRFPIIVYHSGAGSSFEDNSALCELLASHGYVVLGSAYLDGDGSSLGIDGRFDSGLDMAFLVRYAAEHAGGDWNRVALIGHSAGAQAILRYGCQDSSVADVFVLLDTTLDYYSTAVPGWKDLVEEVTRGIEKLRAPMLVTAGPEAMFQLVDTLRFANRTYLTVPEIGHEEFISQGDQRNALLLAEAKQEDLASQREDVLRAPQARARYAELCHYVVLYLNAHLRGEHQVLARTNQVLSATALGGGLHVERAAVGETGPDEYDSESDQPPTPRQLPGLLRRRGADETGRILERFEDAEPRSPLYESNMLWGSLLYELLERDELAEAESLHGHVVGFRPGVLSSLTFLARISLLTKRPDDARRLLEAAILLDPENEEATRMLRALDER